MKKNFTCSTSGLKVLLLALLCCIECKMSPNDIYNILSNVLPQNAIMLEAGAHYGEDSVRLSALRPKGFLFCFEPTLASFKKLQQAVKGKNNIKIFPCALCNNNDIVNFHVSSCNDGANTLGQPTSYYPSSCYQNVIAIQCKTLAKWAEENNIEYIDFLWLDMEGYELSMLKALPDRLLNTIKFIYMEINRHQFWEGIPLEKEVLDWMSNKGFKIFWREDNHSLQENYLFAR